VEGLPDLHWPSVQKKSDPSRSLQSAVAERQKKNMDSKDILHQASFFHSSPRCRCRKASLCTFARVQMGWKAWEATTVSQFANLLKAWSRKVKWCVVDLLKACRKTADVLLWSCCSIKCPTKPQDHRAWLNCKADAERFLDWSRPECDW
jgi:hypothetical protein